MQIQQQDVRVDSLRFLRAEFGLHPWVADEDFGPATRTLGDDHGQSGTIVEFDCGNPDYLVSRVLSASGSLRVLSPITVRQRVAETARAISRRNVGPGTAEASLPRTAARS